MERPVSARPGTRRRQAALEHPARESGGDVQGAVQGKTDAKRQALECLVTDGYAERIPGARGSHLHTSLKPYREGAA